jgi:hypothetical protein
MWPGSPSWGKKPHSDKRTYQDLARPPRRTVWCDVIPTRDVQFRRVTDAVEESEGEGLKSRSKLRYAARLVVLGIATYCGVGFLGGSFVLYQDLKLDQSVSRMLDAEHIQHTHLSRLTQSTLLSTLTVGAIFVASVIVYRRLASDPGADLTSKS